MSELVSLMMVLLLLAMVFGIVIFIAHVQPVKVLVTASARNCARAGIETLAAGRGLRQAQVTAVETARLGTAIDPDGLQVVTGTERDWGRGRVFFCEVGYGVRVDTLPMVAWFYPERAVPIRSRVSLSIEPYKSRWEE